MAIEGVSGTGLEAQSSQTDAVKSLIRWEPPHPLSIAGVELPRARGPLRSLISIEFGHRAEWLSSHSRLFLKAPGRGGEMRLSRREFVKLIMASGITLGLSRLGAAQVPDFATRETLPGRQGWNSAATGAGRIDGVVKV